MEEIGCRAEFSSRSVLLRSPSLLQRVAWTSKGTDQWLGEEAILQVVTDGIHGQPHRLLLLPQPLSDAFCLFTGADLQDPSTEVLLASCLLLCGGFLHGVSMAIRKFYGQGHRTYWNDGRWWLGVIVDGIAGLLLWPAMPILSVEFLVPMCTVTQLGVGYVLGLLVFKEKASMWNHTGLCLAIVGVVCLGAASPIQAAAAKSASLGQWVQPPFLACLVSCVLLLLAVFAWDAWSTASWAMAAAICEAVQFLSSRTLADAMLHWRSDAMLAVAFSAFLKGSCILIIIHCTQQGFEADLSRFAGDYLVLTNLVTVVLGLAFFGDQVTVSAGFVGAALATLAGIWLLNSVPEPKDEHVPVDS